jgi:predicted permease
MQAEVKTTSRNIRISNEDPSAQLTFNKVQLIPAIRSIIAVLLFLSLGFILMRTYVSGSPHFWPLLKATGILTMIASIAFLSQDIKKSGR